MSSQEFEGADAVDAGADGLNGRGADAGRGAGDEVAGYAAEVRAQFADLPDAESADLLEDLEDHLREVAAEDAGTLRERLGAPAAYARELRQAAGLPEPGEGSGSGGPGAGARPRRKLRAVVRDAMADAERWARGYRAGREVLDFLPLLRPAWWVLRAWVAVRLLEMMTTTVPWPEFTLIPQVGDSTFTGLIALLVAVPVSVYAARRTVPDGWRRRAMGAGEGILVLFTIGLALSAVGDQSDYASASDVSNVHYVQTAQSGLAENGKQISNLYVYDRSGKPLDGVYVYDQDGQPVTVGPSEYGSFIDSGGWLDGAGSVVANLFPRQLLVQRWNGNGGANYVAIPPPAVDIPQGVHRATTPEGAQQGSATPSPSTTAPSTPTPTPAPSTPASSPSSGSPTAPLSGATGAQTSSALPPTPTPPASAH